MANVAPGVPVYELRFYHKTQITGDDTTGITKKVPFSGRVIKVQGEVEAIGGTTVATDVDLVFKDGATTIGTAAPVDSSAIVSGGSIVEVTPYKVTAGDVIEMEIDVTGGNSPTVDGIGGSVWIARDSG